MNRITLLLFLSFFFFSNLLWSQSRVTMAEVDHWVQRSEHVVVPDSILLLVREESQRKHIPDKIMNKNMIYFRMLSNPSFTKDEQLKIADYILEVFSGYENSFATELVSSIKQHIKKP